MSNFIWQYQRSTLKTKLILLYLLNITDIIFTLLLVNTGLAVEANPMMAIVLNEPTMTFLVKVILPALLFIYLYLRLKKANERMTRLTNLGLLSLLLFYLIINLFHITWLIILPFFL